MIDSAGLLPFFCVFFHIFRHYIPFLELGEWTPDYLLVSACFLPSVSFFFFLPHVFPSGSGKNIDQRAPRPSSSFVVNKVTSLVLQT